MASSGFYMTVAVIPAYNEEKTIGNVLERVKSFADKIIIVNDGSADRTVEISKQYNAEVLNHILNRGLGAALRTGFAAVLKENAEIIITLDADGQHNPEDILRLVAPIQDGEADVVIGSRFIPPVIPACLRRQAKAGIQKNEKAPLFRKFANFLGNVITFLFFGIWVSDSQSGFRAFSHQALQKLNLKSSGMEVSSEIIKEIKRNKLRLVEIPIKPIYTAYSLSKGQNFFEGIKTVIQLIFRRFE